MKKDFELVKFVDNEFELEVRTDNLNETVWLTQKQMAELYEVSTDNFGLHIRNILAKG